VFGGVLRSELAFPELPAASSHTADWSLVVRRHPDPLVGAAPLGEEALIEGVTARLARDASRFRLTFEDTGTFDVSLDGAELTWYPADGASEELARLDVIGRVLALAEHAAGAHCLHASSVVLDGRAVAFIAPKGFGKSTTAMSLLRQGGRLLTDDTLPVRAGEPVMARPGVHGVRLREDSAGTFAGDQTTAPTLNADKLLLTGFDADRLALEPAPLDAIYLLAPVRADDDGELVTRRRLSPMESALVLVAHGKLATLLGRAEAGRTLARASAIARTVPVYALSIGRDLARIDDAARAIARWHPAESETLAGVGPEAG
jgi:hypothetical protein